MSADQLSMFGSEEVLKTKGGKAISFNLNKTINGPQQAVFDHWLIPVFVGEWMFGPKVQAEKVLELKNTVILLSMTILIITKNKCCFLTLFV